MVRRTWPSLSFTIRKGFTGVSDIRFSSAWELRALARGDGGVGGLVLQAQDGGAAFGFGAVARAFAQDLARRRAELPAPVAAVEAGRGDGHAVGLKEPELTALVF